MRHGCGSPSWLNASAAFGKVDADVDVEMLGQQGRRRLPANPRPTGHRPTLLQRALHICETTHGPDPDVATTLNNLAGALHELGEPAIARPLL